MKSDDPVTNETVERLCAQADLPLGPERRTRLVPMLAGIVAAANELSRKMAAAAHQSILPIMRFHARSEYNTDTGSSDDTHEHQGRCAPSRIADSVSD